MTELHPLHELIQIEFEGKWRTDLATIVEPRSDQEIAALVEHLACVELGQEIRGAFFAEKSVGAVFGLELESGERLVLKLFPPSKSFTQLTAMQQCLNKLVHSGFPAPPPRSSLFQTDDGMTGAFYAFMDGTLRNGHEPIVRQELARVLAQQAALLTTENATGLPLSPMRERRLWPVPNRSFLTLDETPETRWFDEIGRRAQSSIRNKALPLVPAHLDWGVKNCRFEQDKVCVVYDWHSLFAASEAEMVGRAAVQFTAQWAFPAPITPTLAEASAFVREYQTARGRSFSKVERAVVADAADYMLAQDARIEIAAGNHKEDGFLALLRNWHRDAFLHAIAT